MHFLVYWLLFMLVINGGRLSLGLKIGDANKTMLHGPCIDRERQALLIFKASLIDPNGFVDNWGNEEEKRDCCKWRGVSCSYDPRRVIGLNLSISYTSQYHLAGKICPSLTQLDQLQFLILRNVNFQRNPIPNIFGSFSKLQHLDMFGSNLSGPIPHQLTNLSNVWHLDLGHNSLNGNIPDFRGCLYLLTLNLTSNRFTGNLPNSVGQLTHLAFLDVSNNSLSGGIPDFTGCSNLWYLDLSHNNLNGHLPISIGQVIRLQYLDVSFNSLNGVISDLHFQKLTLLTYIDLSFNNISFELGSFPSQLRTIRLQSCRLGPSFPSWLETQKRYIYLDISSAGISQSIPSWFGRQLPSKFLFLNISSNEIKDTVSSIPIMLYQKPGLDLSDNYFEGSIYLPFRLGSLNLSGNKFSGDLSFLCLIHEANLINLSNNSFTGSLPDCWLSFERSLTILDLSNNNLSGKIPSSLGYLSQLEALYMRNNSFVGELPMSLSNCTKLRFVDLGENNLSGRIPPWIGERLTKLYVLVLRSNRFLGSLPRQVCRLSNLQLLDLSKNRLSGNIPECVGNLTAMVTKRPGDDIANHPYSAYDSPYMNGQICNGWMDYCPLKEKVFIDMALVAWKGNIREFGRTTLELLKSIDLSNNNFSGILPVEITSLVELVSLNLSRNKFLGEVPQDIGRLKSLEFLDLSRNEFSGSIPWSLSSVDSLGDLDLSNNNLSGKIPLGNGGKLQLFNSSSYSGNPLLCGPPLVRECRINVPVGPVDDEEDSEFWKSYYMGTGIGFVVWFWGTCGVLFLNRRCRHFLFASLSHVKDWMYITMVVYLRKLKRQMCL